MRTVTIFSLIAFAISFMAISIGDGANVMYNLCPAEKPCGVGFLFFIALVVGVICKGLFLVAKYGFDVDHNSDKGDQVWLGLLTVGVAVCFGYLYGFAVGPWNHGGSAWRDGWLIFLVIAYTPIVLNLNDSIGDFIRSRRKPPSRSEIHRSR